MAFINGLKRVFGISNGDFSDEYDDEEYESAAVIQRPIKSQDNIVADSGAVNDSKGTDEADNIPEVPEEVIDAIAKMLNESLPSWAAPHIDVAAQRKQIWEVLEPVLGAHIDKRVGNAIERERAQLIQIKSDADARVKQCDEAIKNMQAKSEEIKLQLTSMERQKSAITERTRNLENQIATAEAENEQYRLENKSLMNKLKVVQVKTEDADFYKSEVERLNNEIARISASADSAEASSGAVEALKLQLRQKDDNIIAEKKRAEGQIAELEATISELKTANENYASTLAEMQASKVTQSAEADKLREKLRLANEEILSLQDENAEAQENRAILGRIEQEFEILEKRVRDTDERAAKAEANANENAMLLAESERKIEALNQQISENDRAYSRRIKEISQAYEKELANEREKAIKAESEVIALQNQPKAPATTTTAAPSKNIVIDLDDISDDEDDVIEADDDESGNWLQPMTVDSAPSVPQIHNEEPSSKAPIPGTSAPIAEDPRQMSLFD